MLRVKFIIDESKLEHFWALKHGTESLPKDFLLETEKFKKTVELKWKEKEELISLAFQELTGIRLEGEFVVFVLHPVLEIGQYDNEHDIEWGYDELFPNYIVMGIAHEILHCLTHAFYMTLTDDQKWIFHALIYLAIDEELRSKLNGEGEYFSSPIVDTYDKRLIQTAKNILPYHKKYIAESGLKNIFHFYEQISKLNLGI